MRRFLFLFICLASACSVHAAKYITVHLSEGAKVSFAIVNNPKITFTDGTFSIGTEHFLVSGIRKYTLSDEDETSVMSHTGKPGLTYYPNPTKDYVYIRTEKDAPLHLYTLSGAEFPVKAKHQEDLIIVDLRDLKNDTYLIKVGKETIKIQKQ